MHLPSIGKTQRKIDKKMTKSLNQTRSDLSFIKIVIYKSVWTRFKQQHIQNPMDGKDEKLEPKFLPDEQASKKKPNSKLQEFKKQQKKLQANDIEQQLRDHLNEVLLTSPASLVEQLPATPPATLIVILFADNDLKSNLILDAFEVQSKDFFLSVNKALSGYQELIQNHLRKIKPQETFKRILRHIIKRYVQGEANFESWILEEVAVEKGSVLCQLFRMYLSVEPVREIVIGKHLPGVIEQFQKLAERLGMDYTAQELKRYTEEHLLQEAWQSNQFSYEKNLKIYSLDILKYNVLHHFANTGDSKSFFEGLMKQNNPNFNFYHQLNLSGETPIDIAFKRFSTQELTQMMQLIESNKQIRLSERAVNELLQNKELQYIEPLLLKLIRFAKSQIISSRGYVSSSSSPLSQPHNPCVLLSNIDSANKFPLLKYIVFPTAPITDILDELIFPELSESYNEELFNIMLGFNELIKQTGIGNQRALMRIDTFRDGQYRKKIERFDTYIVQLYDAAILKGNQETVFYLIKNMFNRVILARVGYGSALKPFLIGKLIESGLYNVIPDLLDDFPRLIQFNRPKTLAVNKSVIEPDKPASSLTSDYKIVLVNQLAFSIANTTDTSPCMLRLKDLIAQEYIKDPDLLKYILVQGDKVHFPINFAHKFLMIPQEDITKIYARVLPQIAEYLQKKGDRMQKIFISDVFETNEQMIQYFPYDESRVLILALIRKYEETDITKIIRHARMLVDRVPGLENDLKALINSLGSGRNYYKWLKQCASSDPSQFLWACNYFHSMQSTQLQMCVSIIFELAVASPLNQGYEKFLFNLPVAHFQKIVQSINRQICLPATTPNLPEVVRRLVNLGADVQILHDPCLAELSEKWKDGGFYQRILSVMVDLNEKWTGVVLRVGSGFLVQLEELLRKNDLALIQICFAATSTQKNQTFSFGLEWGYFSWSVFRLIRKILNQNPPRYSMVKFPIQSFEMRCLRCIFEVAGKEKQNIYLMEFLQMSEIFEEVAVICANESTPVSEQALMFMREILSCLDKIHEENIKYIVKKAARMILMAQNERIELEKKLGASGVELLKEACKGNYDKWVSESKTSNKKSFLKGKSSVDKLLVLRKKNQKKGAAPEEDICANPGGPFENQKLQASQAVKIGVDLDQTCETVKIPLNNE